MNFDELDPGIREVVRWLDSEGHPTCDSGDGVTKPALGWPEEDAMRIPHVHMDYGDSPEQAVQASIRLLHQLRERGATVEMADIQMTYDPQTGSALVSLYNFNNERLGCA